jgi:multidrug efflux system outer membrane protein
MLAREEVRRAVVITLVADVARVYMELRSLDLSLEVGQRTLASRQEYMELAQVRFEGGVTSEMDWRQAEAEYHRTEALVHDLERQIAQKENELSLLLGHNPEVRARGRRADEQPLPVQIPAGLPSALLERRPDIRAAEQQLIAANAKIGEAKALLYPQISLTGSYGAASTELESLFTGDSWYLLGGLVQPIFNAGKNRRRVEAMESRQRQAIYAYERTILQAFREVEDSLVAHEKAREQRESQGKRVMAERKVLELAELRYRGGVAAYLEVLDAQRSLFNAELEEIQSINDQLVTLIRLYKALGGGWPDVPAAPSESVQSSR